MWSYSRGTFGLSDAEFRQLEANVRAAAAMLRGSCRAGRLRFDLDPESFLREGSVRERTVDNAESGIPNHEEFRKIIVKVRQKPSLVLLIQRGEQGYYITVSL